MANTRPGDEVSTPLVARDARLESPFHDAAPARASLWVLLGILAPILLLSALNGCTNDDEQVAFERDAFQTAAGYTRTDERGVTISQDPDDWRISPLYMGLVEVDPLFPNPAMTSGQARLHVMVGGIDALSGLAAAVYHPDEVLETLWISQESPVPPGLHAITLSPVEMGRLPTVESARGLHRIIVFDGRQNVISYGDVMVQ